MEAPLLDEAGEGFLLSDSKAFRSDVRFEEGFELIWDFLLSAVPLLWTVAKFQDLAVPLNLSQRCPLGPATL